MSVEDVVAAIAPADPVAREAARLRQERLTKPPGSLGRLEELSLQVAAIQGTECPVVQEKTVIVAAGDHGVVAQGVTGYPQEVTAQMVLNFLSGGAAISVMARRAGVKLLVVDAGVATPLPEHPDLRVVGVGRGTADMTLGPAMSREQAEACVLAGVRLAREAAEAGGGRCRDRGHGHREHDRVERHHGRGDRPLGARDDGPGHGAERRGAGGEGGSRRAGAGGQLSRRRRRPGHSCEGGRLRDRGAGGGGAGRGHRPAGCGNRRVHLRGRRR